MKRFELGDLVVMRSKQASTGKQALGNVGQILYVDPTGTFIDVLWPSGIGYDHHPDELLPVEDVEGMTEAIVRAFIDEILVNVPRNEW